MIFKVLIWCHSVTALPQFRGSSHTAKTWTSIYFNKLPNKSVQLVDFSVCVCIVFFSAFVYRMKKFWIIFHFRGTAIGIVYILYKNWTELSFRYSRGKQNKESLLSRICFIVCLFDIVNFGYSQMKIEINDHIDIYSKIQIQFNYHHETTIILCFK